MEPAVSRFAKRKRRVIASIVKSVGLGSFRGQFVGCFECFKTSVSADNLLGVVGVLRLQLQVCGQFVGVAGVLRLQFPRTICWV